MFPISLYKKTCLLKPHFSHCTSGLSNCIPHQQVSCLSSSRTSNNAISHHLFSFSSFRLRYPARPVSTPFLSIFHYPSKFLIRSSTVSHLPQTDEAQPFYIFHCQKQFICHFWSTLNRLSYFIFYIIKLTLNPSKSIFLLINFSLLLSKHS